MIPLDLQTVAAVTAGRLVDGAQAAASVAAVVTDSREAGPGALFAALAGEHADGHDYAGAAAGAGAIATLATRPVGTPAVVVDDVLVALGRMATAVLDRADGCQVVGVTGSSGKTSTKDLLAAIFTAAGPTVAPTASFNNEIGLPLTVFRIDDKTRTLVLEYSARGRGHIAYLTTIARPDIAVVLNVGAAHLGEFGSRAAIAEAKGELVEALPSDGCAVLNADDDLVVAMRSRTAARVVTFGEQATADVRVTGLTVDDAARPSFRLVTPAGEADIRLRLHGRHHASNAAAAAAAAIAAGLPLAQVAAALEAATPRSPHRMAVSTRPDGLVVIDDAYNANPESMRAAIDALVALSGVRPRYAVLGEMRELGPDSERLHREVGDYAASAGLELLVGVGGGRSIAEAFTAAGGRAAVVDDAAAAVELLRDELAGAAVVLVKASNSIRLWTVAEALVAGVPAEARR